MSLWKVMIGLVLVGLLVAVGAGVGLQSAQAQSANKNVTLASGDIREVTVPFVIKEFRVGDRGVVRVEQMGDRKVRVVGIKEGSTDLQVIGDGDMTEIYKIAVGSSLDALLVEVRKDIDEIAGVEANTGLGKVVLRGTVTKPEHWRRLKRLMRSYGDRVDCKVNFRIQDELLLKLKTDLERANFKVLEKGKKAEDLGCLSLASSDNNILISGAVSSRGEVEKVNSIVCSYPWLKCKRDNTKDDDDDCYAVVNVAVAPVMLEVDVAFVGVTDKESNDIGANLLKEGVSFVTSIAAAARGAASYQVASSLAGTLQAIGGTGPGRFKSIGHLTFKNDATDWKSYQDGGTITLPIMGANGGVGTQPIDYGLILKAKGGLVNADEAALDLEVELSVPILQGSSPAGPIYDLKRSRIVSTIQCPVGKTLIMGGTKQLTEGVNFSGTPILGKVPLLNFLFSETKQSRDARQVLILISPQMARGPTAAPPAVDQTAGTLEDVEKPLTDLGGKRRK